MQRFRDVFTKPFPIIGMIHLLPLPGSPSFGGDLQAIYDRALHDARALEDAGVDAAIVENLGDEPYRNGEPPQEQLAVMAAATRDVARETSLTLGVNVQFNAWQAEVALAYALDVPFVRLEVFVDTVVTAQGILEPCSADVTRQRARLGAEMLFLADVQPKYTRNLLDQTIEQSAADAAAAGAQALIVTGSGTGKAAPLQEVDAARAAVDVPVLVGSGTTIDNLKETMSRAQGAIVGSALKEDGSAPNPVSPENAQKFMDRVRVLRE